MFFVFAFRKNLEHALKKSISDIKNVIFSGFYNEKFRYVTYKIIKFSKT